MASKKQPNLLIKYLRRAWNFIRGLYVRRSKKQKIVFWIVVILVVILRVNSARKPKFDVNVTKAQKGTLVESISTSGEVKADKSANLVFETGGEVTDINVILGQEVKKDEQIAKLDTADLYAAYMQANASLRKYQASLNSVYDTVQGHETDESFAQIDTRTTAETAKDSAYWAYEVAARNLAGATLRAPFDGIVTLVPNNVTIGSYIALPYSHPFQVTDPKTLYLEVEVNELEVPKLTSNQKVYIEFDAYPSEIVEGLVQGINFTSSVTSTGGNAYLARVTLPSTDGLKYRVGMSADADLVISEHIDVLKVPADSIMEEDGNSYVWLYKNGKIEKTKIEVGTSSINEIGVTSGISESDIVVNRPSSKFTDGVRVNVENKDILNGSSKLFGLF